MKTFWLSLSLIFLLIPFSSNAQFNLKKINSEIKKARQKVELASVTITNVLAFKQEIERTTEQFNIMVTVSNGTSKKEGTEKTNKIRIKNGKIKQVDWNPVIFFENELFPSAIVSLSTYRGKLTPELEVISRPLGFKLLSNKENFDLRWEIECTDKRFFDKVSGEFTYETAGKETFIMPEIPWDFRALTDQISNTPVQVIYRLYDSKGKKLEHVERINIRSINDCIWRYRDTEMYYLFSAYVQESHPDIDLVLKQALETNFINGVIGYQGTEENVFLQVAAIWKVLHDKGFKYSSITTPSAFNPKSFSSQSVRTFEAAYNSNQANCVDGTVVFASILRKIGISSEMVFVPGHCFLAFYTDKELTKKYYLETTRLSDDSIISKSKTEEEKENAYIDQFLLAMKKGQLNYERYKDSPYFKTININEARVLINPIPFQ